MHQECNYVYISECVPELMVTGESSEDSWQWIMGDDALGSVYPRLPAARNIIQRVKENVDELYYETFIDFMLRLNVVRLNRATREKKWISTFRDAMGSSPPSSHESTLA